MDCGRLLIISTLVVGVAASALVVLGTRGRPWLPRIELMIFAMGCTVIGAWAFAQVFPLAVGFLCPDCGICGWEH